MNLEMDNYYLTFFKSRQSISHLEVPSQMQFAFQKAMMVLAEFDYITVTRTKSGLITDAVLNEAGKCKVQELFYHRNFDSSTSGAGVARMF